MSGAALTRGHEDITRFGVEMANAAMGGDAGPKKFFQAVTEGEACATTANELLAGNCATDWPTDEMTAYYGVSASAFGDDPGLQDLHSLRNFDDASEPVSGRYACYLVRGRIVNATQRGLQFWKDADQNAAMRWIGHATHTVQDSFTPCHTSRSGTRFETMEDICTYGVTFAGICTHHKPDTKDAIWRLTPLECTFTTTRSWDCLVDEAQAASKATAGYLQTVARLIDTSNYNGVQAALDTWFEGDPTIQESGYFHCDALKVDGVEPDGWSPPGGDSGTGDASTGDASTGDAAAEAETGTDAAKADVVEAAVAEAGQDAPASDVGNADGAADAAKDAKADSGDANVPEPAQAQEQGSSDGGCGCRTGKGAPQRAWPAWLVACAAVTLRRRRRALVQGH
jgi:MYXO-CTERM domain-containing protein